MTALPSGAPAREATHTAGYSLALGALDFAKLAARTRKLDPAFQELAHLKSWSDLAASLDRGNEALDGLSHALTLLYAHRFSGLALRKERHQLWLSNEVAACALNLKDAAGDYVVRIETWVTALEARAKVSLTYFAP